MESGQNNRPDTIEEPVSISEAAALYLDGVGLSRSAQTSRTYRNGINLFLEILRENGVDPDKTPATDLSEDALLWVLDASKHYAATSERLYLTAIQALYSYLIAKNIANPNIQRIKMIISQRARRPGIRLPQFPRREIEAVLAYAETLKNAPAEEKIDRLRNLRDRAFVLCLADTGLRVHEACNLRRGDVDWEEQKAVVIGKGNRQAVVRFSRRSLAALRDYLALRSEFDGGGGRMLTALPLFARHDRGAGKKIKSMTPTTGRNIVSQRVAEALGEEAVGRITPHSFRHYFVTVVLRGSGGNLKLAQALARHQNIAVTQRYAHLSDDELDRGYAEIFDNEESDA